jgi:hypothetical protein
LPFVTAAFAVLEVDDAGTAHDGLAQDRMVARIGGVPVASVRVALVAGQPTPTPTLTLAPTPTPTPLALTFARAQMARVKTSQRDRVAFTAIFEGDPLTIDPATQAIGVVLRNAAGIVYARTIDPGSLVPNKARTSFAWRDEVTSVVVKRTRRRPSKHTIRLVATHLDLAAADLTAPDVTATFSIGDAPYEGTLVCRVAKSQRSARCLK